MKRIIRRYLLGLLVGGLLAGCTAGPVEEIVPEENRPVTLSFGKPDLGVPEVLSRGGETAVPKPLPKGTTVRIGAYFRGNVESVQGPISFSALAPSFQATYVVGIDGSLSPCLVDATGKKIDGKADGLTVKGGVYDFYAVSPARVLEKGGDNAYQIRDIPHKEDVMTSFVRGVTISATSRRVTLATFCRKCASVVFNVAPSQDNALPFKKLYGTKLVVSRISSSGASLIAGEDTGITPTGGSVGDEAKVTFESVEFESVEAAPDIDEMGLNKTKGVVLPKDNKAFDVEITVVRDQETATLHATIDQNITFDAGKRYIFTLEIKNNESSLLMKVLNWNTIAFTDAGVGGSGQSPTDPDINEGIGTTIKVAQWNNIDWTGNGNVGAEE
ncbi:BF2992 family fimbrillin-A clan protein [Parabacteroides timonensis]|uniref:BF2992 family fimbrillin-A clan protein n=1 Tax=Parabacteroides timonensis TaxID=1871013 RepID=UPI00094EBE09|nr:fimbrillin family protein [Parabacteroides timonensis]